MIKTVFIFLLGFLTGSICEKILNAKKNSYQCDDTVLLYADSNKAVSELTREKRKEEIFAEIDKEVNKAAEQGLKKCNISWEMGKKVDKYLKWEEVKQHYEPLGYRVSRFSPSDDNDACLDYIMWD